MLLLSYRLWFCRFFYYFLVCDSYGCFPCNSNAVGTGFFRYAFKDEAVFAVRKGSIAISGTKITKFFYNEEDVVVGSKSLGITEFCGIDDFDGGFRLMYKKAKYQFIPFYVTDFSDFDAYIQAKLVIAKQIGIDNII